MKIMVTKDTKMSWKCDSHKEKRKIQFCNSTKQTDRDMAILFNIQKDRFIQCIQTKDMIFCTPPLLVTKIAYANLLQQKKVFA